MSEAVRKSVSEKTRSYRTLNAWQQSMRLVTIVYGIAGSLPPHERYALGNQLRRAAVSIPSNIAEGQGRAYRKEFIRHLSIARGSLAELDTLLIVCADLGYLPSAEFSKVSATIIEVRRLVQGLIRHLRERQERSVQR